MRVQRQQFIDSQFMRIELISFEKKWMHHNRYHLQITLDKQNLKVKKKYSQLKRFTQEVEKSLGVKNLTLEPNIRTNDQYKSIQQLLKRLNSQFLEIRQQMSEKEKLLRREIRNYLYNMLFYNDEMVNFSDSDDAQDSITKPTQLNTPHKLTTTIPQTITPRASTATNQLKTDKSIKNKSMALAAQLVSTVLKKVQIEPMKQIFKNIHIIWFLRGEEWHQCRLVASQTSLILHDRHENVKIVIIICKMTVYCCEEPYQRIILTHRLLNEKFQFRLTNTSVTTAVDDPFLSDRYLAFYSILKSLCHKQRMIETFNFIKVRINFAKGISMSKVTSTPVTTSSPNTVDKKGGRQIALKLIHNTIVSAFTVFPEYPCEIIVPIVSSFGVLQFFSTEVKQNGVLPNFKQNIQNFSIPVQNIYDTLYNEKPKRKTQIHHINLETKNSTYELSLQYSEAGTYETYYTCDTQNDKFEGNIQFDEMNRDEVRIQFNRLKRITWTIEQYVSTIKDLTNFSNQLGSYLFYAVLVFVIVCTDMNFLMHYFIALLIGVMLYNHPLFPAYKREVIEYLGMMGRYQNIKGKLRGKSRNSLLGEFSMDLLKQELQVHFIIDSEKRRFLQQFELRMRKKRNIYKKYKRLQQVLVKFQNILMQVVNYIEKVKNIFTWYHHKKSRLIYLGLVLIISVIIFIPIRFLLLLGVYKMFKKGRKYYAKTRDYNENVVTQVFLLTLKDNKLNDMMQYLNNDTKVINKRDPEYQTFQKRIKENLTSILRIEFNHKVFELAKTIKELRSMLSLCKKRYKIPLLTCRKYQLSDKFSYKESSISKMILGFIVLIPSDRNILGVKTSNDPEGQQKQGNQALEENRDEFDTLQDL